MKTNKNPLTTPSGCLVIFLACLVLGAILELLKIVTA